MEKKTSPRPPWVLRLETSCIPATSRKTSPVLRACERGRSKCGADTRRGGSDKSGGTTDEDSEGESMRDRACSGKRWGLGIFVHEKKGRPKVERSRKSGVHDQVRRKTLQTDHVERSSRKASGVATEGAGVKEYCARVCHSALMFRPKTAVFGYRTPLAYRQGYGCERLGVIFASREDCGEDDYGYGLSTKKSSGKYTPADFHSSQSAPESPEKTELPEKTESHEKADAASEEKIQADVGQEPKMMDEMTKCRLYTSEFLCKNPCVAYLPWQKEKEKKKKKKKKKVILRPPTPKCMCSVQVNTAPMTSTKFTEMDSNVTDQCTWVEVPTCERGSGTEVTTVDQYTNVTPLDLDGPRPEYYSLAASDSRLSRTSFGSRKSSERLSEASLRHSVASFISRSETVVEAPGPPPGPPEPVMSWPKSSHSLVNDPGVHLSKSGVSVPTSFTRLSLNEIQNGEMEVHIPWDGLVSAKGAIVCCPPCVEDPGTLGRFWRHTPKFSDMVRPAPSCDCCAARMYENNSIHSNCKSLNS